MINLGDQVAQGVSDASLTSDVRAFNALALAKEQLSQQRALLNYSFSNPSDTTPGNVAVDPNTELALQIASQEEFSNESAFQQAATPAERAFLASTLSSSAAATSVAAAQNIETNVIANEGSAATISGSPLGLSILGAEDSTSTTPTNADLKRGSTAWDAGMGAGFTPDRRAASASSSCSCSSHRAATRDGDRCARMSRASADRT